MSNHQQQVVLISGANKGIGFEVAQQLGRLGMTVLVGARDTARGQAAVDKLLAEKINAAAVELDLLRPETITGAVELARSRFGRLDVLINNAGIVDRADGPPETASADAVERIFKTNFLGALRLTQAALPLLREAPAARIVNVSSGLGSITLHGDPTWPYASVKVLGYCASKAAMNMMTVQLAFQLRETTIKVNSADPGYTATDLNGNSGPQTVAEGSEAIVRLATLKADGPTGGFFDRHGVEPW